MAILGLAVKPQIVLFFISKKYPSGVERISEGFKTVRG
jgi:hypothetical protein